MAGAADTACVEVIIWVGQSSRPRTVPACDEAESHAQQLGYTKERVACTGIAWGWACGVGRCGGGGGPGGGGGAGGGGRRLDGGAGYLRSPSTSRCLGWSRDHGSYFPAQFVATEMTRKTNVPAKVLGFNATFGRRYNYV